MTDDERKIYNHKYYLQNIEKLKERNKAYGAKHRKTRTPEEKAELYKKWRNQHLYNRRKAYWLKKGLLEPPPLRVKKERPIKVPRVKKEKVIREKRINTYVPYVPVAQRIIDVTNNVGVYRISFD